MELILTVHLDLDRKIVALICDVCHSPNGKVEAVLLAEEGLTVHIDASGCAIECHLVPLISHDHS